ncbi:MAG: hypothetical protein AAF329_04220 [Cyanobacteria bacterium P01_A01_bin.17]
MTTAQIKLWLSPNTSVLQADITLHPPSGPATHHQAGLALAIESLPEGFPAEEYLPATQWIDRKPYYGARNRDVDNLLELSPLFVVVSLMVNLRGWVEAGDLCVKDLSVNDHAAKQLRPEPGRWLLGKDGKRLFVIEKVTVKPDMQELIDPS